MQFPSISYPPFWDNHFIVYLNGSWACLMVSQAEVFLLTSEVGVRMRGLVSLYCEAYSLPSAFGTPPNVKAHAVKFHHPPAALAAAASQPAPFHSVMTLASGGPPLLLSVFW